MVRMQHATIATNTPFHPHRSAIHPTPLPAIADPNTYPKKPVNPAAVPAAFYGTRSSACSPLIMIAVNEKPDRDERRVIDPERTGSVQPVDDDGDERRRHEENGRRGAAPLEHAIRHPPAGDGSGDGGVLVQRPADTRLAEREAFRGLKVRGNPVHDAVPDEVHERIRDRDRPQVSIAEYVLDEYFTVRECSLVVGAVC